MKGKVIDDVRRSVGSERSLLPPARRVHRDDDSTGTLQISATRPPGTAGVSGQGTVVTLTFMAKASGQSTLAISKGVARDPAMHALPVAGAVAIILAGPEAAGKFIDGSVVMRNDSMPPHVQQIFAGRSLPLLETCRNPPLVRCAG